MTANEFKDFFLPFSPDFYRVAYRMLGNSQDAEDAVQDLLVKLWNIRDTLSDINSPQGYGISVIRNICIDRLRSSYHKQTSAVDVESYEGEISDMPGKIDDANEIERIRKLMRLLPDAQKKVFELRYFKDCTIDEIIKITGLGAVNVRVLLSRARKNIKTTMLKEFAL